MGFHLNLLTCSKLSVSLGGFLLSFPTIESYEEVYQNQMLETIGGEMSNALLSRFMPIEEARHNMA